MAHRKETRTSRSLQQLWFERVMAILALTNLSLVLFDLSYIPWRDFWRRDTIEFFGYPIKIPLTPVTNWYDKRIKGIEEHRDTKEYLDAVGKLKNQVVQTGLRSPQVEQSLEKLRNLSVNMIETNPFALANKTGTLEKIKNRMTKHIGQESSKHSFNIFWSQPHLSQAGWQKEIGFYDQQIEPLIKTNYYRDIGENGEFIDNFLLIDIWFIIPFAIEFLLRTYYSHRRHASVSWIETMLWRCYDIFMIVPFFRWLRVIPVTLRLHHAELLNLEPVRNQINRGFVANFAEDMAEVVVLRVINQLQTSIKKGEIIRWEPGKPTQPYIDINNVNEMEAIAKLLMNVTVYKVIPKIQPDLEAILKHNIEKILSPNPVYQAFTQIPGLGQLPNQITERIVGEISQAAYNGLTAALQEDTVGEELTRHLLQHFSEALSSEVQKQQTLQYIQSLVVDMLEEIKINYVQRLPEEDVEHLLEQSRQMRAIVKR